MKMPIKTKVRVIFCGLFGHSVVIMSDDATRTTKSYCHTCRQELSRVRHPDTYTRLRLTLKAIETGYRKRSLRLRGF